MFVDERPDDTEVFLELMYSDPFASIYTQRWRVTWAHWQPLFFVETSKGLDVYSIVDLPYHIRKVLGLP